MTAWGRSPDQQISWSAAATRHRGSSGTLPWRGGEKKFRKCTRFMDSDPGENWKLPFVGRGGCERGREEEMASKSRVGRTLAGGRSQRGQQESLFVWEAVLLVPEGSTPSCNSIRFRNEHRHRVSEALKWTENRAENSEKGRSLTLSKGSRCQTGEKLNFHLLALRNNYNFKHDVFIY